MAKKHYASTDEITRARQLRVNSTEVEKRLWNRLRDRQVDGHKFRRQHYVAGYYLDFACEELKVAVELDGGQHNDDAAKQRDEIRTARLQQSGWRVLRFWNNEVMENIEGVLLSIQHALTQNREGRF
jgi:very-short-patch-repair endonuclease